MPSEQDVDTVGANDPHGESRGTGCGRDRSRPRPARAALLLAAGVLIGSIGGVTGAYASHRFTDVPTSSPFHADIEWLADQGISTGYNGSTTQFAPDRSITRQAMAAWLHRYAARTVMVTTEVPSVTFVVTYGTATCPAGTAAVGGGGEITSESYFRVVESAPTADRTGWYVQWRVGDNISRESGGATVYAICQPRA